MIVTNNRYQVSDELNQCNNKLNEKYKSFFNKIKETLDK